MAKAVTLSLMETSTLGNTTMAKLMATDSTSGLMETHILAFSQKE